jgi:glucan phosphorylase
MQSRALARTEECASALKKLGTDLDELLNEEEDAALGNGGAGRLTALGLICTLYR